MEIANTEKKEINIKGLSLNEKDIHIMRKNRKTTFFNFFNIFYFRLQNKDCSQLLGSFKTKTLKIVLLFIR